MSDLPIISFYVDGDPVPYVRQSQRDKWDLRPAVARYHVWCDLVRLAAMPHFRQGIVTGPVGLAALFSLPIPPSWPAHKRGNAAQQTLWPTGAHTGDVDNLVKGIADALQGTAWQNDAQVIGLGLSWKAYGRQPGAWIMIHLDPIGMFERELRSVWDLAMGPDLRAPTIWH